MGNVLDFSSGNELKKGDTYTPLSHGIIWDALVYPWEERGESITILKIRDGYIEVQFQWWIIRTTKEVIFNILSWKKYISQEESLAA